MTVTQLNSNHDGILGIPWLGKHEPAILWKSRELTLICCRRRVRIHGYKLHPVSTAEAQLAVQVVTARQLARDLQQKEVSGFLSVIKAILTEVEAGKRTSVSPTIQAVLDEFSDVLVEDLPPGLPTKTSVDHRIELVPGTTNGLISLNFGCHLHNWRKPSAK